MRLKKRKVTIVFHGRLEHHVVRHPQGPPETKGVTWLPGHVSPSSRKGKALLAAGALQ